MNPKVQKKFIELVGFRPNCRNDLSQNIIFTCHFFILKKVIHKIRFMVLAKDLMTTKVSNIPTLVLLVCKYRAISFREPFTSSLLGVLNY